MIKDAKCTLVVGRRGSGKSTLTRRLIAPCDRVVVLDPMREYTGKGWRSVSTLRDVHRHVKAGWATGFRISYAGGDDPVEMLAGLSRYLWAAQAPYDAGRDRRKITLVVEEMNMAYPNQRLPTGQDSFRPLILQGRHRGIEIIGVTQRPALVSTDFRGMCAQLYIFPLGLEDDRAAIARQIGRNHAAAIAALEPHTYLAVSESGIVENGANPPLRRRNSLRT